MIEVILFYKHKFLLLFFFPGQASNSPNSITKKSNKLLVKHLPDGVDEQFLEMFFEHTKRHGGGPVKSISLYSDNNLALVEFEGVDAVDEVLKKRPIKMQGTTVEVEMYTPYLESDESLQSIDIFGIPKQLIKDIAEMKVKHPRGGTSRGGASVTSSHSGTVRIEKANKTHPGVRCDGCGIKPLKGPRYNCDYCTDFNYCSECKASKSHTPNHHLIKLESGEYPTNFIHSGFRCDGCRVLPIKGTRYRCKICHAFDYCEECISNNDHDSSHVFMKL